MSERQKAEVIALAASGMSNREIARKFEISEGTVRNILLRNPEITQICAHKKEENLRSVLEFMDSQRDDVCSLIGKLVSSMSNQKEIDKASVPQLATALGIVVDKYTKKTVEQPSGEASNNLLSALDGSAPADWADSDDSPEDDDA